MSLSNQGREELELLKDSVRELWGNNLEMVCETITDNPMDEFELEFLLYGKHKVLLRFEMGTFSLQLWTGQKYEYLNEMTDDKMVYGFESMETENILHNFKVLDDVLKTL